ncbi:MAG: lecithin retinol acyltransferase family protein [Acholeplasmatales bacterium]|nr:lecithin retinol acyltransferase family protein [Acholeplasmatales bacterium]
MNFRDDILPVYGDQIRVSRGLYYHHGIYVDDANIIQFGSLSRELNPEDALVLISDLKTFLRNGVLEVRVFTEEELKTKKNSDEVVKYALSKLGEKGYNIITNNCEHFCNECIFGVKQSEQVDSVLSILDLLFSKKK